MKTLKADNIHILGPNSFLFSHVVYELTNCDGALLSNIKSEMCLFCSATLVSGVEIPSVNILLLYFIPYKHRPTHCSTS